MQARQLLVDASSHVPEVAKKANAAILSNSDSPAFMHDVITAAGDVSLPPPVRQLALLTTKNAPICRSDERLVPVVQQVLPPLLEDPDVARIAAVVLSFMIVKGSPDDWFPVYSNLVDSWSHTEPFLRCVSFIAQDGAPEVLQAMIGAATRAAQTVVSGAVGDDAGRVRHCFVIVSRVLANVGLYADASFAQAVQALFTAALSVGLVSLEGSSDEAGELLSRSFELERECVRFFIAVCQAAAAAEDQSVTSLTKDLVTRVFGCLHDNVNAYARHVLTLDGDLHEGLEGYTGRLLDLIEECMSSPVLAGPAVEAICGSTEWIRGSPSSSTDPQALAVDLLLRYGMAPPHRMEEWTSNPNVFLEDEDKRIAAVSTLVRDTAHVILKLLVRFQPATLVPVVTSAVAAVLYESAADATWPCAPMLGVLGGQAAFWRLRESTLAAIDTVASRCKRELVANGANLLDDLAARVVSFDVRGEGASDTEPVLQARALAFLGTVVRKSSILLTPERVPELIAALLPACCATVGGAAASPLLAVAACRLMHPLLLKAPQPALATFGSAVPTALLAFVSLPAATGDVLYGAMEALQVWAQRSTSSEGLQSAPTVVCRAWQANTTDPNIGELVVELFKVLTAGHPACEASLFECLPWLSEVLQGCEDPSTTFVIPYILEIIGRVLLRGTTNAASTTYSALLGPLCHLILSNEDSAIVSKALKCVASVIDRAGMDAAGGFTVELLPSSLQIPPGFPGLDEAPEPAPLPDVCAALLYTVLSPERRESTLMNTGPSLYRLLGLMAWVGHGRLGEITAYLFDRTDSLRTDMVLQEVLLPVLRLFRDAPQQAIVGFGDTNCARLFGLVFSRMHFFDGGALAVSVEVAQGCVENADELGVGQATVTLGSGRSAATNVPVPVAAFVGLSRVLVALHDGEISAGDAVDLDDGDDDVEVLEDDDSNWSSDSSGDDGDEADQQAPTASPAESMGSKQPTSVGSSPTTRSPVPSAANAPRPPQAPGGSQPPPLRQRILPVLANWVPSLGPQAAPLMTQHQVAKLQRLWAKAGSAATAST